MRRSENNIRLIEHKPTTARPSSPLQLAGAVQRQDTARRANAGCDADKLCSIMASLRHTGVRLLSLQRQAVSPSWLSLGAAAGAAWFSTGAAVPAVDAAEVAKALQTNDFLTNELPGLRAQKAAMLHGDLLAYMQQRWDAARFPNSLLDSLTAWHVSLPVASWLPAVQCSLLQGVHASSRDRRR
jgi:hypothetical protein